MSISKFITRVKMVKCTGEEPQPPCNPDELENWCSLGYSARPVQQHVGDYGIMLWENSDGSVCVQFDDEDERVVFREEIEILSEYFIQVRMVKCIVQEPLIMSDLHELKEWLELGYSLRPRQYHLGDKGFVLWEDGDSRVCVVFDNGDKRILLREEIEVLSQQFRS